MEIQVHKLRNALGLLEGLTSPEAKTDGGKPVKGRGRKSGKTASAFPVLSNVLLRDGKAMATDLETAITVDLPEVTGECLLPFDKVTKLLKYVNGNDEVKIEMGRRIVTLAWSEGKAALETESAEDYPQIPRIESVIRCSLLGDMLVPNLLSMLDYCAEEASRPVLAGVSLFLGEPLEIAAGDGFRMAYKTLSLTLAPAGGINTVVIPSKAVATLGHVWSKAPRPQITEGSIADLVATKGKIELEISPTSAGSLWYGITAGQDSGGHPAFIQAAHTDRPSLQSTVLCPGLRGVIEATHGHGKGWQWRSTHGLG